MSIAAIENISADESFHTSAAVGKRLGVNPTTVIRYFANRPGVIRLGTLQAPALDFANIRKRRPELLARAHGESSQGRESRLTRARAVRPKRKAGRANARPEYGLL